MEDDILGILGTFLQSNNEHRESSERLYDNLEQTNPNLMMTMLSKVVKLHTRTFECLLALCKIGDMILTSSIRDECPLSTECLSEIRALFLNVLSNDYPDQMKDYVLSVLEDFIYITDGDQSDWPELIPFFLALLETNTYYALSFFNTFIQVNPTTDLHVILSPKLQLDSPDSKVISISIKYLMTSLYVSSNYDPRISQIPEALAALPEHLFAQTFHCIWKLLAKNPAVFENIHVDLIGVLLTISGDSTRPELQRRAALFFFTKMIRRISPLRKIASGAADRVVKVVLNCLTHPNKYPDLYSEAKLALETLTWVQEMHSYIESLDLCGNHYVDSVLVQFSAQRHYPSIFEYLQSNDSIVVLNGLEAVDSKIDGSMELGKILLRGMKGSLWSEFLPRLVKWCHVADTDVISTLIPNIFSVLDQRIDNIESMLCETLLYSKGFGIERMDATTKRLEHMLQSEYADARHVEVMSALLRVTPAETAKRFLCNVMPSVVGNPSCINSVDFCLFVTGNCQLVACFLDATLDSLMGFVHGGVHIVESTETISTLVDLVPAKLYHRVGDMCLLVKKYTKSHMDQKTRLVMYRLAECLLENYDDLENFEEWIPAQLDEETDSECYGVLLTSTRKFIEKVTSDATIEILKRITLVISRAVEEDSDELFASAASLFLIIMQKVPEEATRVFFQIQKVFPRYDADVATSLRCFSLILWTDFVLYGPSEHVEQYRHGLANDLRKMMKSENDERVRIDAIISSATYYSLMKVSEIELENVLDIMFSVASDERISEEIRDVMISGLAQVIEKTFSEKTFPKRIQELLAIVPMVSEKSTERVTIYESFISLALMCWTNNELKMFTKYITDYISSSIYTEKIAFEEVELIRNTIIAKQVLELPEELRHILYWCEKYLDFHKRQCHD